MSVKPAVAELRWRSHGQLTSVIVTEFVVKPTRQPESKLVKPRTDPHQCLHLAHTLQHKNRDEGTTIWLQGPKLIFDIVQT